MHFAILFAVSLLSLVSASPIRGLGRSAATILPLITLSATSDAFLPRNPVPALSLFHGSVGVNNMIKEAALSARKRKDDIDSLLNDDEEYEDITIQKVRRKRKERKVAEAKPSNKQRLDKIIEELDFYKYGKMNRKVKEEKTKNRLELMNEAPVGDEGKKFRLENTNEVSNGREEGEDEEEKKEIVPLGENEIIMRLLMDLSGIIKDKALQEACQVVKKGGSDGLNIAKVSTSALNVGKGSIQALNLIGTEALDGVCESLVKAIDRAIEWIGKEEKGETDETDETVETDEKDGTL